MAGYPESLAPGLLGTIISLTALSTVFMGLRIFCRVKLSKFGWDDAWMAVTLVSLSTIPSRTDHSNKSVASFSNLLMTRLSQ